MGLLAACGKKGPPLPPFVARAGAARQPRPRRVGDDVYVSFTVPSANVGGQKPAESSALEVYAVTGHRSAGDTEEQPRRSAT